MKRLSARSYHVFLSAYKRGLLFYLVFGLLLSSCVTQRNLEYIRKNSKEAGVYSEAEFSEYRLKSSDALYIQISSLDDAASNVFAQAGGTESSLDPYSAYLSSYTIDQDGFIDLPVIGKLDVSGKTTLQVSQMIKDSVENILSLPVVAVKLVNQYVSVLGEVRAPGHFVYSQDKFTVFNALSMAGDITPYGNRKQVIIVRSENGETIRKSFDLTNTDILSSEFYFIQPNDLVYVKPMRKRFWGTQEFPFALVFSTITTGLLIYTIFINPPQ